MTLTASDLQRLHHVHQRIAELKERQEAGPRQLKAIDNRLAGAEQRETELKELHTRTRMTVDEKNLNVQEHEARIADLQTKLNTCSSNKEYQALTEDIAKQKQAASDIEDVILETLEELSEQEQGLADIGNELTSIASEGEDVRRKVEAQSADLDEQLAVARAELVEAEQALPVDFRDNYQRMADARGDGALAPVDNECCSGCYQRITPQMINELYLSQPVFCKNCGCLLYLNESGSEEN